MDHSNIPVFKRPTKLPTREELALILIINNKNIFKFNTKNS